MKTPNLQMGDSRFSIFQNLFFENSNGLKLCGILSNPTEDKNKPIIILCHGFSSSKDSKTYVRLEKALNHNNISTFRFDFFGHGESEGSFEEITISEAVDDALHAVSFLKNRRYMKIGLFGSSFGGMASLVATSKSNSIFILALKAPVSDYLGKIVSQITRYPIEEWKNKGFIHYINSKGEKLKLNYGFFVDAERVHGYNVAKKIKIPTLIVHGDKDQSVPFEQSKKTANLIEKSKLEIIIGADHGFSKPEDFQKMLNLVSSFILEQSH